MYIRSICDGDLFCANLYYMYTILVVVRVTEIKETKLVYNIVQYKYFYVERSRSSLNCIGVS